MSDKQDFGFGKFVPGFDFLQNLTKGASQAMPQMSQLSSWVAPTLSLEEVDKRIGELKAVQFWLEQNSRALTATIQALEVQKMTLATLKGMNFDMGDLASALKLKPEDAMAAAARASSPAEPPAGNAAASAAPKPSAAGGKSAKSANAAGQAGPGVVDPMQWWGALTQQFAQIATSAMGEGAAQAAVDTARTVAAGVAEQVMKGAGATASTAAPPAARKSGASRKGVAARKGAPTRKAKQP